MAKKRVNWIDTVKGIAIVCVMLGHIDWGENPLCIWIYSFHMPVWFFLSGVLAYQARDTVKPTLPQYAVKKASSLLYPYFTFSMISISYITVCMGFGRHTVILLAAMLSLMGISGAMWFLPVMFFSSVLFEALRRLKIHGAVLFGLLIALIWLGDRYTPFEYYYAVQRVLISVSFIYLGYYYEMSVEFIQDKRSTELFAGFLFLVCGILSSASNGLVDLHYGTMNDMLRYYHLALCSCVGLCLVGSSLCLPTWLETPLRFLGKNSLIILATHVNLPYISLSRNIFSLLLGSDGTGHRYADDLVILFILLALEYLTIVLVNRFGRFLLHPKYLKKTV